MDPLLITMMILLWPLLILACGRKETSGREPGTGHESQTLPKLRMRNKRTVRRPSMNSNIIPKQSEDTEQFVSDFFASIEKQ